MSPAQAVTTNANVTCEGDAATLSTGLNLYKQRLDFLAESDARFGSAVELVYESPKYRSKYVSDGSWKVAHNDRLGYAPDAKAPEVFEEAKIAGWTDLQNPEAQWISGWAPFGESQVQDSQGSNAQTSFFYKLAFNLEEPSIATLGKLTMHCR